MQKTETPEAVCHKCKKPAVGRYSPDIDIAGLAFCEEHRDLIGVAFYCLMTDRVDDFNDIMGTNLDVNEI